MNPSQKSESFDDLLARLPRPGEAAVSSIQFDDLSGTSTTEFDSIATPITPEEVERSSLISFARKLFEATRDDCLAAAVELLDKLKARGPFLQNNRRQFDDDDFDEGYDEGDSPTMRGTLWRTIRLWRYEENVVAETLGFLAKSEASIAQLLCSRFLQSNDDRTLTPVFCSALSHCPSSISNEVFVSLADHIERILIAEESGSSASSELSSYLNLLVAKPDLSVREIILLLELSENCHVTDISFGQDWYLLNSALANAAERLPETVTSAISFILRNGNSRHKAKVMALNIGAEMTQVPPIPVDLLNQLLDVDSGPLRSAAIAFAGCRGSDAISLVPRLIDLVRKGNSSGAKAIVALGRIHEPRSEIAPFLLERWGSIREDFEVADDYGKRMRKWDEWIEDVGVGIEPSFHFAADGELLDPWVHLDAALGALAAMGSYDDAVYSAFLDAAKMPNAFVRRGVIEALHEMTELSTFSETIEFLLSTSSFDDVFSITNAIVGKFGDVGRERVSAFALTCDQLAATSKPVFREKFLERAKAIRESLVDVSGSPA